MAYRGRIAPSPTGRLHEGHRRTFLTAAERARGGALILRIEDIDRQRCREEYCQHAIEDLRGWGICWTEGPDVGGGCGPYRQSERTALYLNAWRTLLEGGHLFPCSRSRKDVAQAASAPHSENEEPIYPLDFRPEPGSWSSPRSPKGVNWRFRVPWGRVMTASDGRLGRQEWVVGKDFGDFIVWRQDDVPSYQLAVVVDDHAMGITEVVRGEDLVVSTARQILLYEALGWQPPAWYHTELVRDGCGRRLAKRAPGLA